MTQMTTTPFLSLLFFLQLRAADAGIVYQMSEGGENCAATCARLGTAVSCVAGQGGSFLNDCSTQLISERLQTYAPPYEWGCQQAWDAAGRTPAGNRQSSWGECCTTNPTANYFHRPWNGNAGGACGLQVYGGFWCGANCGNPVNLCTASGNTLKIYRYYCCACEDPNYVAPATTSLGDPITSYKGKQTRYWLPTTMTQVFAQGALEVFFQPGTQNRSDWVTKAEIRHSGSLVATIGTVEPSALFSPINNNEDGLLTTMALEINGSKVAAEGTWSLPGGLSIEVEASVKKTDGATMSIGSGAVDRVIIKDDGAELQLSSAMANKMPTEMQRILGIHLDTDFRRFDKDKCTGLLPEIWGLRPKSELTKRMMQGPMDAEFRVEV